MWQRLKKWDQGLAGWVVAHPWRSIGVALLVAAALLPGLAKVQSDFTHRGFFRKDDPLILKFDTFERRFGNDDVVALVVHSPTGIFVPEAARVLREITDQFWRVSEIIRVDSLANYNWSYGKEDDLIVEPFFPSSGEMSQEFLNVRKAQALGDEILPNYLVSKDGNSALILARFKPVFDGTPQYDKAIGEIRELLKKYEDQGDYQFHLSGNAMVNQTLKEVSSRDMKVLIPLLCAIVLVSLLILFRRASGVLLPVLVFVSSTLITFGFAGWFGIKFNTILSAVPSIIIAISICETIHVLVAYFHEKQRGVPSRDSALYALKKNIFPTFFTSLTTAVGFIGGAFSHIVPIAGLSVLGAVGTMVAWIFTVFVVGAILSLLPQEAPRAAKAGSSTEINPARARAYVNWIERHSGKVVLAFLLLTVTSVFIASRNEVNSDPIKYFAKDIPFRVSTDFMDEHVGGATGAEVVINSGATDGIKEPEFARKVEALGKWIAARPYVSKVVSYTDIVKMINRSMNGNDAGAFKLPDTKDSIAQELFLYSLNLPQGMDLNDRISADNDSARITALWTIHDSKTILAEFAAIEAKAKELGLDAYITGKMPIYQSMITYVVTTFVVSDLWTVTWLSIFMIFLLGSWKLGLLSMVPNVIPIIFGAAALTLLGRPFDMGSVIVGSICLGIVVDDTIHFLLNYGRAIKSGKSKKEAIEEVLAHSGLALSSTTVILVLSFGTFAFSSFAPNVNLGIGIAVILAIALITDLLLMPALLFSSKRI